MGSCFSSSYSQQQHQSQPTAKVITSSGSLREYSVNLKASVILESELLQSYHFLCSSDSLYYNEFIQPLSPMEEIEMGEIYFILPSNRLKSRLSASDMAALAVKASSAIGVEEGSGSRRRRGQPLRISPIPDVNRSFLGNGRLDGILLSFDQKSLANRITPSGSVKKMERYTSKRAKKTVVSFRSVLNTIQEGTVAAE